MKTYSISMDIGGTSIKSALIEHDLISPWNGSFLDSTYSTFESKASQTKDIILNHFVDIIDTQAQKRLDKDATISSICIAIPGPFDYKHGISYMKGLGKYDSLYGVNLKDFLLDTRTAPYFSPDISIRFCNDALAFAYGEAENVHKGVYQKVATFTLGTGCGSTFLENKSVVAGNYTIPDDGMIYHEPMLESIIDDYISIRYLLHLANTRNVWEDSNSNNICVKQLYHLACTGNETARSCFLTYGELFAKAIRPYIHTFQPDAILLGGGISQCYPLFEKEFRTALNWNGNVHISSDMTKSALVGAVTYLNFAP